uniref:SET domain-containing protein n=1 Tax=viral metagenome TaxID=1070528 RepID=A0A6C0CMS3_9ZZZZ
MTDNIIHLYDKKEPWMGLSFWDVIVFSRPNGEFVTSTNSSINIDDGDILLHIKPTQSKGLGVYTLHDIPMNEIVGVYPGNVLSMSSHNNKIKDYLEYSNITSSSLIRNIYDEFGKYLFYLDIPMPHIDIKPPYYIDPTDSEGVLIPKYKFNPALLINEPSPGELPNLRWVINSKTGRVELRTTTFLEKGQELLIWYGDNYKRDYDINSEECSKIYNYIL